MEVIIIRGEHAGVVGTVLYKGENNSIVKVLDNGYNVKNNYYMPTSHTIKIGDIGLLESASKNIVSYLLAVSSWVEIQRVNDYFDIMVDYEILKKWLKDTIGKSPYMYWGRDNEYTECREELLSDYAVKVKIKYDGKNTITLTYV